MGGWHIAWHIYVYIAWRVASLSDTGGTADEPAAGAAGSPDGLESKCLSLSETVILLEKFKEYGGWGGVGGYWSTSKYINIESRDLNGGLP